MSHSWFITGASSGIGRAVALAALARGDRVHGVARRQPLLEEIATLHPHSFTWSTADVTDPQELEAAFAEARAALPDSGPDTVLINAGGMVYGMLEETTDTQIRDLFELNVFAPVRLLRLAGAHLRARGGGRILLTTSMGGTGGMASVGTYAATKSALTAYADAAAMELSGFGISVTNLLMGGYDTGLFTAGTTTAHRTEEYAQLHSALAEMWGDESGPAPRGHRQCLVRHGPRPPALPGRDQPTRPGMNTSIHFAPNVR